MAICYGIPAFVFCLVVVPTSAQNLLRCTYRENDRSTTCRGGTWPAAGETPNIGTETTELGLWDIAFQKDNVAAIPSLPNLEKLSIAHSNWQAGEGTVKLPFKELLRDANRPALLELGIENSRYGSVDAQEFAGFTSLRKLAMRNNTLLGIHVKAFGEKVSSCENLSAVLEMSLTGNRGMTSFSWESLQPLSCRLQTLRIQENEDLTEVKYDGSPMELRRVATVDFSDNEMLKPLSKAVVDTIHDRENPTDTVIWSHHFRCDSCNQEFLDPLVSWTRAGGRPTSRFLRLSCNIADNSQSNEIQGGTAFWNYFGGQICRVAPEVTAPSTSPSMSSTPNSSQIVSLKIGLVNIALALLLISTRLSFTF